MEAPVPKNERTLLRVIVWCSTIAVAGSLALMFGFDKSDGQFRYHFTLASVLAFIVGTVVMLLFWKKVFSILHDQKRTWRFIILSSIGLVVVFIGCVFLPQFRPYGNNSGDLLTGMVLGFLAVAAVFYFAAKTMRLFESADEAENVRRHDD